LFKLITMTSQEKLIDFSRLQPGLILARKYEGFLDKIPLWMGSPYSDFPHYAVIANPVDNGCDWNTYNATVRSIMKFVKISRYKGQHVRIYSVKNGDPQYAAKIGEQLVAARTPYEGLSGWNYIFRIAPSIFKYWFRHGIKPLPWDLIPNADSAHKLNCLVLIRKCYPDLLPISVAATACAFEAAYREGKLILEQEGFIP
jgi:hypothetical protein